MPFFFVNRGIIFYGTGSIFKLKLFIWTICSLLISNNNFFCISSYNNISIMRYYNDLSFFFLLFNETY